MWNICSEKQILPRIFLLLENGYGGGGGGGPGGGLPLKILGGGMPPGSPNPDPISDQKM